MVKKRIRQALIILVFVWMAVIFGLSSRPASLSSKDSYRVGKLFSELFVPGFKQ
jgi:VanZ family protein